MQLACLRSFNSCISSHVILSDSQLASGLSGLSSKALDVQVEQRCREWRHVEQEETLP